MKQTVFAFFFLALSTYSLALSPVSAQNPPGTCTCVGLATPLAGTTNYLAIFSNPATDNCIHPDFLPRCSFKAGDITNVPTPSCKCEYAKYCTTTGQRFLDPPSSSIRMQTALGCIPVSSGPLLSFLLSLLSGIGGGIALLLILYAAFQIMTAGGDAKKVQAGKELLTAALVGLAIIALVILILNFFGVNVLGLRNLGFNVQT